MSVDLPFHPRTGLRAIGLLRNGVPVWPALGGSEDDDGAADDVGTAPPDEADDNGADDSENGGDARPDDSDSDGDKPLGPAGEKALAAEKEKRRTEAARRRAAEKERDEALAELDKARRAAQRQAAKTEKPATGADGGKATDGRDDIDPEDIRRDAEKAAVAKANERIVKAEVRASAAGKLADPKDALRFLDLTKFEVDADGNVDTDEIDDAIADLLKTKPYLAVPAQGEAKRFKGSGDGGAKPNKSARARSIGEAVARKLNPA